ALAKAKQVDPGGRPLFGMIVAATHFSSMASTEKEAYIRSNLLHELLRWQLIIPEYEQRERMINLIVFSTILSGIKDIDELDNAFQSSNIDLVLPDVHFLDDIQYRQMTGGDASGHILPSLQPDLIGEFLVLERLKSSSGSKNTKRILEAAWGRSPEAVSEFVVRAVSDYPKDPAASMLQEPIWRTKKQRNVWSRLVSDLLLVYDDSEHPQVVLNMSRLRELAQMFPEEQLVQRNRAGAEMRFGFLLMQESRLARADD